MPRAHKFKKYLAFYKRNFDIQPPFYFIADAGFIKGCIDKQLEPKRLLGKLLSCEVHLCLLPCVVLDSQIKDIYPDWAGKWQLEHVNCGHETPLRPSRCIKKFLAANQHAYCAALSDPLKWKIANTIFSVPIVFLNETNVLMVSEPSEKAKQSIEIAKSKRTQVAPKLIPLITAAEKELHPKQGPKYNDAITHIKRQNKKAKGPNPLAVKKKQKPATKPKKVIETKEGEESEAKKKRKRKRKRTPEAICQTSDQTDKEVLDESSLEPPLKKQKT